MSVDISSWAHIWELHKDDHVLLRVHDAGDPVDGCLIYDTHGGVALDIEDDELARAIMRRMLDAGIPIVTPDCLPPGKYSHRWTLNAMIDAGKSPSEINAMLAELRARDLERQRKIHEWHAQRNAGPPT